MEDTQLHRFDTGNNTKFLGIKYSFGSWFGRLSNGSQNPVHVTNYESDFKQKINTK